MSHKRRYSDESIVILNRLRQMGGLDNYTPGEGDESSSSTLAHEKVQDMSKEHIKSHIPHPCQKTKSSEEEEYLLFNDYF